MGQFRGLARNYVQDTPDILANEGTEVMFGGMTATYMATPGHTPGSSVIRIGDCLFTGDTLFRHEVRPLRPLRAAISLPCCAL